MKELKRQISCVRKMVRVTKNDYIDENRHTHTHTHRVLPTNALRALVND